MAKVTKAETSEAIMVGDVRVLAPPPDGMKAMGNHRGLFLSLDGVETRLNEFMRRNPYHWRLRLSDVPVARLPDVAHWLVFMGLAARQERPCVGLERSDRGAHPLRGAAEAPLGRIG